jgi:NhaP-type Na+/H+ or K+/H+ antiporter
MLFFVLFLNLITNNNVTLTSTIITFIRLSIGGVVVGIIFGMVISYWIRRIVRDDVLGVMVVVSGTYLCFFLTEFTFIQVSGIWSVISLGLYISSVAKRKIYP